MPLPDHRTRLELLRMQLDDPSVDIASDEWDMLAQHSAGASGSDLAACASEALMRPLRELQSATCWRRVPEPGTGRTLFTPCHPGAPDAIEAPLDSVDPALVVPRSVTAQDVLHAVSQLPLSVDAAAVARFEAFATRSA